MRDGDAQPRTGTVHGDIVGGDEGAEGVRLTRHDGGTAHGGRHHRRGGGEGMARRGLLRGGIHPQRRGTPPHCGGMRL